MKRISFSFSSLMCTLSYSAALTDTKSWAVEAKPNRKSSASLPLSNSSSSYTTLKRNKKKVISRFLADLGEELLILNL